MKLPRLNLLTLVLVGVGFGPALLAMVPEAEAQATAKAKCRVRTNPARVQIAIGADGLAPGTADFRVTNPANTNPATNTATINGVAVSVVPEAGDAAVEWDSAINAADPPEGTRASIAANFVGVGGTVTATVTQGAVTVGTDPAATTCVAK